MVLGQLAGGVGSQVVVVELRVVADAPQVAAGAEQSPGFGFEILELSQVVLSFK